FKDLYLAYYFPLDYFPSDVLEIEQHVTNSRNTSIALSFESQLDDFFKYAKKTQTSQFDSLQEVK
ncbi:46427_t:CDS:1, partial [Gigaspora margarita]